MRPALIQPILIVLACAFILFMLSGCVVAPYPERAGYGPKPHYDHHHGRYWRRNWR